MTPSRKKLYFKRPDSPKPRRLKVGKQFPGTHSRVDDSWRDWALEHQMVESSGAFDLEFYLNQAGKEALADPIGHYLSSGWRSGFEPNASFSGEFLLPYYETLGLSEPPLITWLTARSAGWLSPVSGKQLLSDAASLRKTELFDEEFYLAGVGGLSDELDAAIHYILIGEQLGIAPSQDFDPNYYRACHHDLSGLNGCSLLHYIESGRAEGRSPLPRVNCRSGGTEFNPGKENIILVVHETSRTGAPILGWNIARELVGRYNLQIIHLGDGELTPVFEKLSTKILGPFSWVHRQEYEFEPALAEFFEKRTFRYAIVNSAESRIVVDMLIRRQVPTLMLVHEFGAYVYPPHSFRSALDWSTEIIFPAHIVAAAAEAVHPVLCMRQHLILPQGASVIPVDEEAEAVEMSPALEELIKRRTEEGLFIVLGAGTVHIRKGIELFIATAAAVQRSSWDRKIHFLWVGHGFRPKEDMHYSTYLQEQINRSGVADRITFLDAVPNLDAIYEIANAFFLSSRLDPLPNVSIDAAMLGIPLVCFKDASGTAELLLQNADTALGVVDHLDTDAAGKFLIELAADPDLYRRTSEATAALAREVFNMKEYVSRLDEIGIKAGSKLLQRARDLETLSGDSTFDQDMFLGASDTVEERDRTIARYLALGEARTWKPIVVPNTELRRPSPGFNPRLFAEAYPETLSGRIDPLAEYIRLGKPAGPWQVRVLGPQQEHEEAGTSLRPLRTALHAHLYYPELAANLLLHLQNNRAHCDLWITTGDALKAERLVRAFGRYQAGSVTVLVVPNRGRDFGPLLTALPQHLSDYDLIGHVHGKRSVGKEGGWDKGDEWREFIWQNLLGGEYRMLDRITAAFEQDRKLGLVFPSDPHFVGWDENLGEAQKLAERLGWTGRLPQSFDFPLGSMFWARREALRPLLEAGFTWDEYPAEPVPRDGTFLHALERMLPTICCDLAGFHYAVTHLYGVSWTS